MDILIDNNKIKKIDKNIDDFAEKIIDATGKVVMPGLINTHSHIPMSIFRETLDGYNLQDWLTKKIWPIEDNLTSSDVYYSSYLSFMEMIRTGTTTVNDMYFITEDIIKAMQDIGVRLQTSRTLMDIAGIENGKSRLDELQYLIDNYKDSKLTFNSAMHGLYDCSPIYTDMCIDFSKKNNIPIHMHFCENAKELEEVKELHGKLPVDVLKEKFKDIKVILAHGVKLSKEDIDKIKDMNISIAHCPISNLKLGCGIANVDYMLKSGINVTLGTDGQGSGSNLDMFEAMKYASLLQKGIYEDPKSMPAYEVLKMATINGAKALGLDSKIGSIEVGKLADIIIIDMDEIILKPLNNLISELVYNVKGNNVSTTIIDGKILMEDKKLIINKSSLEIYNKCEEIINRIYV